MKNLLKNFVLVSLLSTLFISLAAFAADASPDLVTSVLALISAYKTHAGIAAIIVAVVQLLKSDLLGGLLLKINQKWIPVIMLAVTGIGGAAQSVLAGKSWLQGLVDGFVTSGLAMTIYESVKSISAPKV